MNAKRKIGIIAFPFVQGLDIVGPADAFASARLPEDGGLVHAYEVLLIGISRRPVVSESGIIFRPNCSIRNSPLLDTLIIPGGRGIRTDAKVQASVAQWVRSQARQTRRIAAVCTGAYAIAPTGRWMDER